MFCKNYVFEYSRCIAMFEEPRKDLAGVAADTGQERSPATLAVVRPYFLLCIRNIEIEEKDRLPTSIASIFSK